MTPRAVNAEKVWVRTLTVGSKPRTYHTNPNCQRLHRFTSRDHIVTWRVKPLSLLNARLSGRRECLDCNGKGVTSPTVCA